MLPEGSSRLQSPGRRRLSHENHVLLLTLAAGICGVITSEVLLFSGDYTPEVRWTLSAVIVASFVIFTCVVRSVVLRPLQVLANMQAALREGDYLCRIKDASPKDAMGQLMLDMNLLSDMLQEQRLGAMETSKFLAAVMGEIEVAIFAFDPHQRLKLINRAGERLLAQKTESLLGRTAHNLGLAECLTGELVRTLDKTFPGASGRWGLRRNVFRQQGLPHQLLVLSDLSQTLREEERQAWKKIVRVLGHELNNSLAPICSIAQSLEQIIESEPRAFDWEDDLRCGLRVIGERSGALNRFMKDYARLARLPQPRLQMVDLGALVADTVRMETRMAVELAPGPSVSIRADPDQLQQLLINLIKNAVEASFETHGGVKISWTLEDNGVTLYIQDEGLGISNSANLFVPFFTTKPGGSGIGLALSRQIAEAHGGTLILSNRPCSTGSEARLKLPSSKSLAA